MHIGKIFNIPIIIHPLTLILFALFFYLGHLSLIISLFSCVLLHELGHAWAANQRNIPIESITLLPIGGVLRIESVPIEHEFFVTICGPLVNVILIIFGLMLSPFLETDIVMINAILAGFNLLIPVYPMDGGRILRASLAYFIPLTQANYITKIVSRIFCLICGALALNFGYIMVLIIMITMWFSIKELDNE